MRYPVTMFAILFLIERMRRLIVSTLQCRISAISNNDLPLARRFNIAVSSAVKPHSAISSSRIAVGNWSFAFLRFSAILVKSSVTFTTYKSIVYDVYKVI